MAIDYDKRNAERDHLMSMVPKELPTEVDQWIEDVCFDEHQYLAYDRDTRYMFCSHCGKHISLKDWPKEQIHQLVHLRKGICPECSWAATYICMGRYVKRVMRSDEALFLIAQRTPEGLVFRRFDLVKQIQKDPRGLDAVAKTTLYWREVQRVFNNGTEVKYWCLNDVWCRDPGWFTVWKPSKRRQFGYVSNMGYEKQIAEYEYTGNIRDEVDGTCFQYATEYKERCNTQSLLEKLMTWIRPIEYIERLRWSHLAQDIRAGRRLGINLRAATPEKMLHLSRQHIKLAAEANFDLDELAVLRRVIKEGHPIQINVVRWLARYSDQLRGIRTIAPMFDPYRIVQSDDTAADLYHYRDYIQFCQQLGYDLTDPKVLYPHNLRKAHDREMKRVKLAKDAALKEKVEKRFNADSKRYGYVTPTYLIRPPVSLDELHAEGAALHHCVGSYTNRVAEGETTILFLRSVTKPDKPFYTLEWRKDRLVQIRGDHNVPPTPEVAEFVEQWQKHMSKPRKQRQQKQQPAQMMAAGQ